MVDNNILSSISGQIFNAAEVWFNVKILKGWGHFGLNPVALFSYISEQSIILVHS